MTTSGTGSNAPGQVAVLFLSHKPGVSNLLTASLNGGVLAANFPLTTPNGRFNYGYVGPVTLPQPTLLDLLGPWPWRIGAMMAAALAGFILLQLPWVMASRRADNRVSI